MFFIKKTQRTFANEQSVINHLRKVYSSIEEAYLFENQITEIPKCKFCHGNAKFISYFQGYGLRCNSQECIDKIKIETYESNVKTRLKNKFNRSQSELAKEFKNFLIDNLQFYQQNFDIPNVYDPFFKVNCGNISLFAFLRRKFDNHIFIENRICKFCDREFKLNIVRENYDKHNCNSKQCRYLKELGYNNSETLFDNSKDLNNFILSNRLNKGESKCFAKNFKIWKDVYRVDDYSKIKLFHCPETGWIVPLSGKSNTLIWFLRKNNIDELSYFEKYLPNQFLRCEQCGNIELNRTSGFSEVKKRFCSVKCFNDFRKNNRHLYEYTEETRIKQSETMKRLIQEGKFTPCITNSWTHWDAKIELEDGSNKKFRSSWEACFWNSNQHLKFELLRIPYYESGVKRNYVADFYDDQLNILYELKPKSEWLVQIDKMQQVIDYCLNNGIRFIWINEFNILNYIDQELFFDSNKIQLQKLLNGIKEIKYKVD